MQYPLFKLMRLRFLFLISIISGTSAYGYPNNFDKGPGSDKSANVVYPTPPASSERLFYVQRTPNANTIVYDLNLNSDGKLNAEQPVKVYWLKYAEKGQKTYLAVMGGILSTDGKTVSVLCEAAELKSEIDVTRAQKAKERAEAALKQKQDDAKEEAAKLALARAITRIKTAQR